MSEQWLGCVVSIDCGSTLGHYQGQVISIDLDDQTVTINQAYHNGKKSTKEHVTISSNYIVDLQIIRSKDEADDIVNMQTVPLTLSEETRRAVMPQRMSPIKIVQATGAPLVGFGGRGAPGKQNFNSRPSPTKFRPDSAGGRGGGGAGWQAERNAMQSPEKEFRSRKTSDATGYKNPGERQRTTPKKIEGGRRNNMSQSAFSLPTESIMGGGDFDFEKSNSMFDKRAEFEKIENGADYERTADRRPSKYRHDENVLPTQPAEMRQIKVPGSGQMEYVTDTGLIVPTIAADLRGSLIDSAEQNGFTTDRLVEQFGRSASELAMQLLGGNYRWVPNNNHQKPTVVVLCGPHLQGAFGVNCARHLANHGANVVVFSPSFKRMNPSLESEIQLLGSTTATRISNTRELPSGPVDLIVNGLDNHEHGHLRGQTWFKDAVKWSQNQRARCLALDPPREGPAMNTTWSLGLALPLALTPTCGQHYLCDVGIPNGVFARHGIDYTSPFGHKFTVLLSASDASS